MHGTDVRVRKGTQHTGESNVHCNYYKFSLRYKKVAKT